MRVRRLMQRCSEISACCAALLALLAWLPAGAWAATEEELKAAFIYNFAKFTEWPSLGANIVICLAGNDDSVNRAVAEIENRSVQGRPIKVVRGAMSFNDCQILFVGGTAAATVRSILKATASAPVLTISDIPSAVQAGSMIELVPVQDRLKFDVNLKTLQDAGLKVRSQLLQLARTVHGQ